MAVQVQQQIQRRLFSVNEYHALAKAGILAEDDRVELLCGEIIDMAPIGSRHAGVVTRLTRTMIQRLNSRAIVATQNPIQLNEGSEPQPDLAVLSLKEDDYTSGHPTPADVYLLIEVCDTTLAYDRDIKAPLYAQAGVPETWLVDLEARRIEAHRQPSPQGYRQVTYAYPGDTLSPQAFADVTLAVDDVLPE